MHHDHEIKVLDSLTVNKIAAGEVIERPFSVVKELVENAADAGATKIDIEIRDGGKKYIKVSDNGTGIAANAVETAFIRHATSKITHISDMNSLQSMGFRGEALASIASVSQLEMLTKTDAQSAGRRIELFGGSTLSITETACTTGTTVSVRNLFYNVPARGKFLKSTATESGYISDYVNKAALSRPDIAFSFINNHTQILKTPGKGGLINAIYSVYGKQACSNMLPVELNEAGIVLSGFIGKPELARANRSYEDFFVNNRYVKDKLVSRAAEDACKTFIMQGRFPHYILHMTIAPSSVDVNAHPQKLEVRFADEQAVYGAIYSAVSAALRKFTLIPKVDLPVITAPKTEQGPDNYMHADALALREMDAIPALTTIPEPVVNRPAPVHTVMRQQKSSENLETLHQAQNQTDETGDMVQVAMPQMPELSPQNRLEANDLFTQMAIVGQLFATYWIVQQEEKLYIIDQHAAHEKILYEEIVASILEGGQANYAQMLVEPLSIKLTAHELGLLQENISFLEQIGYDIVTTKECCFIKSAPVVFQKPQDAQTFRDILDELGDAPMPPKSSERYYASKIKTIATIACKAAVKGNDRLTETEARALIRKLMMIENPFTCPHGRPTMVEITKKDIEKIFKRVL